MSATIEIRPPHSSVECSEAYSLVEQAYRRHGYCEYLEPDEQSPSILIAVEKGSVIGTIGIRCAESGQLPIEHYFGFTSEKTGPYRRSQAIEICKLASSGRSDLLILKGLVTAASQYCYETPELGLVYFSEKPVLAKVMRRFLYLPIHEMDYPVIEENVNRLYAGYFLTDPRPVPLKLYTRDLPTFYPRLQSDIAGKVRIELNGFDPRPQTQDVVMRAPVLAAACP